MVGRARLGHSIYWFVEQGGPNKLDNYPSEAWQQTSQANFLANRNPEMGYVSQLTLEEFPHPHQYQQHLRTIQTTRTELSEHARQWGPWDDTGYWGSWEAGYSLSHYIPPLSDTGRTKRNCLKKIKLCLKTDKKKREEHKGTAGEESGEWGKSGCLLGITLNAWNLFSVY